jgi:hypothetical protein
MKSRPTLPPDTLTTPAGIEALARAIQPTNPSAAIAQQRFLATLSEDHTAVRAVLTDLYPTLRSARDQLKLLAVAAELLDDTEQPLSHGARVLLEMARDGE